MDILQCFEGSYLSAASLGGHTRRVVIAAVAKEPVGDPPETKVVMRFIGGKAMVLNKTNASVLAEAFGRNTEAWIGKVIELYTEKVQYAGKPVDGVRVRSLVTPPVVDPATISEGNSGDTWDDVPQ